jgi:Fic-DOC domain mobile mystery protein B
MAKFKMNYPDGSTPIDPSEMEDLIPDYISTQGELNTLEQANIADAFLWAERANLEDLLTATFILTLHKRMFGDVWKWSGQQRKSNKNIGVSKEDISQALGALLKDVDYWIKNKTFPSNEIAVKFHHRLVQIHIFPNGNGRHARLITNLLLKKMEQPSFTWGFAADPTPIEVEGPTRESYITALKTADAGDYRLLLKFVRS